MTSSMKMKSGWCMFDLLEITIPILCGTGFLGKIKSFALTSSIGEK
jgi:hypothetical protein